MGSILFTRCSVGVSAINCGRAAKLCPYPGSPGRSRAATTHIVGHADGIREQKILWSVSLRLASPAFIVGVPSFVPNFNARRGGTTTSSGNWIGESKRSDWPGQAAAFQEAASGVGHLVAARTPGFGRRDRDMGIPPGCGGCHAEILMGRGRPTGIRTPTVWALCWPSLASLCELTRRLPSFPVSRTVCIPR